MGFQRGYETLVRTSYLRERLRIVLLNLMSSFIFHRRDEN
jgi:hypothetical protein